MIGGQTLFVNAAEENFMPVRNETRTVENQEAVKAPAGENTTVAAAVAVAPQIDLSVRFARLKKTMRRRSSSIF
jgi:hypothetical protein